MSELTSRASSVDGTEVQRNILTLGCIPTVCDGNELNVLRRCPDSDSTCGAFGGKRKGGRFIKGVDIKCEPGKRVFAPFNGTISHYRPFRDQSCVDNGLKIVGEGQWTGYYAVIAYIKPIRYGGHVKKGEVVGYSINHNCIIERYSVFEPYVAFFLYRQGKPIDPTYHLRECFCTGRVCESNNDNSLLYPSYKVEKGYGKGWEIQCPDVEVKTNKGHQQTTRMPYIYSPIKGEVLGRFRPRADEDASDGYACTNDGVFILGTAEWRNFSIHLYNVKFAIEPGHQLIDQGQIIGKKMNCTGENYESVFLEMRYKGKFVNFTDMLLGRDCRLPASL